MSGLGGFTPKPGEGFPQNQPGQPMGPSFDPALGVGLSDQLMAEIGSLSAEYNAKLQAWSAARNQVDAQIAAVRSGVALMETVTKTILPLVGQVITAQLAKGSTPSTPGMIDQLKGELVGSLKSSIDMKSILTKLVGGLGLPF